MKIKIAIVVGLLFLIVGGTYFAYQLDKKVAQEAQVKEFITDYVHLTQDEEISDFYKVSKIQMYENARLANNLWKAIYLSKGIESKINQERFAKSTDRFILLKKEEYNIKFVISEIDTHPIDNSGNVAALVRGEYQAKHIRSGLDIRLPKEFLGKKEFKYIVEPAIEDVNAERKYNLVVSWSETKNLE